MSRARQVVAMAIAGVCILGCGKDGAQDKTTPDSTRKDIDTGAERSEKTGATRSATEAGVHMLSLDLGNIPTGYDYTGSVMDGARWTDANGENVLLVSRREIAGTDDEFPEENKEELFGYHYINNEGTIRLLWKIYDFAHNPCDGGHGLLSNVIVRDLNNDGIAENAFVYNIQGSCDVSPIPIKLMLHSGSEKYAIRGNNKVQASMEPGAIPDGGEMNFDPAFNTAPPEFRTFADELWRNSLKKIE